ncbi:MAG: nucleotide exchange factor GrpE [Acidobacteria bacterium]|nr:nucleotide exchange factor GrpE [Acidobacteriota bacterium]
MSGKSSSKKNTDSEQLITPPSAQEESSSPENLTPSPEKLAPSDENLTPAPSPPAEKLEETVEKLLTEKRQLFDQLLRKQADLENFRKRTEREKSDFLKYSLFDAVKSLLPILDGFELALGDDKGGDEFRKGMRLIYKQLLDALQKLGLEAMEAKGREFDPRLHEAVMTMETSEYPDQQIVEELQRGYFFKQRLLRPAMVKVAKHPAQPAEPAEGAAAEPPDTQPE